MATNPLGGLIFNTDCRGERRQRPSP